jgi:flagellar biosynthesis protein FliP
MLFQPNSAGDGVKMAQALVPYVRAHSDPEVLNVLMSSHSRHSEQDPQSDGAKKDSQSDLYAEVGDVGAVFVLSELKAAVSAAALVLVPFIIIDLLVAHLIALLGMQHLKTQIVSLPLKLMLFLAVDGWSLLISKLVAN